MQNYPKSIKRQLRKLAQRAYEQELAQALEELAADFDAWRAGKIDSVALNHHIHAYHQGPSRDLFGMYDDLDPSLLVGRAIVAGLLTKDSITEEVRPYVEDTITFYRRQSNDGES